MEYISMLEIRYGESPFIGWLTISVAMGLLVFGISSNVTYYAKHKNN